MFRHCNGTDNYGMGRSLRLIECGAVIVYTDSELTSLAPDAFKTSADSGFSDSISGFSDSIFRFD